MTHSELVTVLVLVLVVVAIACVGVFDRRRRRREGSVLSGVVGSFDTVFHPEAARAMEIREIQKELPAEAPAPGDPFTPEGTIVVRVSKGSQ